MSDRTRIAIVVATALLLGANAYGHAFEVDPPGVLYDLWYGSFEAIVYGLAVFAVFLAYRWWALLPAIAPMAVTVYLHELTDYSYPFHEDFYEGLSGRPLLVLYVLFAIAATATFLSIGLLLRRLCEMARSRWRGRPGLQA
ncbi:MAG TPA: hypothetical protein VGV69_03145 [Solirubrobacterales bacterium]|nr:hypothetical protein [Solirubrobacterales bacterium]